MKKLLLLFFIFNLLLPKSLFAQQEFNKLLIEEYIRQSETQKKTGLIMLGAGLVSTVAGTSMFLAAWGGASAAVGTSGVILFTAGSLSTLISIPVIISSAAKGRKAAKMSLVSEKVTYFQNEVASSASYPALSFSFPIHSLKP
jgi:hypothetical protein